MTGCSEFVLNEEGVFSGIVIWTAYLSWHVIKEFQWINLATMKD